MPALPSPTTGTLPTIKYNLSLKMEQQLRPCSPRPVSPSELPGLDLNKTFRSIQVEDPFSDRYAIKSSPRRRRSRARFPGCIVKRFLHLCADVRSWAVSALGGKQSRLGIQRLPDG